jgi:hypothetical protein
LLLILIPFVFATNLERFANEEGFPCKNELPSLTIGDHHVTEINTLSSIRKGHDVFILGISKTDCDGCCTGEIILSQVQKLFELGELEYEGKILPIVRVDISKYSRQMEEEKLYPNRIPAIFVYFKGSYYEYMEIDNLNVFLIFLNKVLHPLAEIKTEQQVEMFVNLRNEYIESTPFYKTKYRSIGNLMRKIPSDIRVLALISDDSKYSSKIKELETTARKFCQKAILRVGVVRNSEVVGKFKEAMGENWFEETSKNTVVFFSEEFSPGNKKRIYDIETDDYDLESWISYPILDEIDEFTPLFHYIAKDSNRPIFLAFLHENFNENDESKKLYRKLQLMKYRFPNVIFSFTDDSEFDDFKLKMGIIWNDLPALGLFNNKGMTTVAFPRHQPFTLDNLVAFFGGFMYGKVNSEEFSLPNPNLDFGLNIPHAKRIVAVG